MMWFTCGVRAQLFDYSTNRLTTLWNDAEQVFFNNPHYVFWLGDNRIIISFTWHSDLCMLTKDSQTKWNDEILPRLDVPAPYFLMHTAVPNDSEAHFILNHWDLATNGSMITSVTMNIVDRSVKTNFVIDGRIYAHCYMFFASVGDQKWILFG